MQMYRFDLLFSYWIFAWTLLYVYRLVPYSPKLALYIASAEVIGMIFLMIFWLHTKIETIFYFIVINSIIKGWPLYYLRNESIHFQRDVLSIFVLFLIYLVWVTISSSPKKGGVIGEYLHMAKGISKGSQPTHESTPGVALIYDIKSYLFRTKL